MLRLATLLATILIMALPAQAARIEFRGTFHITSVTQACIDNGNAEVGEIYRLRFNPPDTGDNPPRTGVTLIGGYFVQNFTLQSGSLIGTVFKAVDGSAIGRGLFTFPAQMRITDQIPDVIQLTTVSATIIGNIRGFDGEPTCQVGFRATGFARVN